MVVSRANENEEAPIISVFFKSDFVKTICYVIRQCNQWYSLKLVPQNSARGHGFVCMVVGELKEKEGAVPL